MLEDKINCCKVETTWATEELTEKDDIVAGWNEFVKEHKKEALYRHQIWLDNGRPPQGEIAFNRRRTQAKYHYAIKFVNKEKSRIRSNRMAEAIANNHDRNLWMEAKKIKQTNNSIPNIMDNVSGSDNTNSLFEKKIRICIIQLVLIKKIWSH